MFWNTTGQASDAAKGAGRGDLSMRRMAPALADAVLHSCLEFHRVKGDAATAALLAEQVWQQARCSDPAITELRATTIAAGGRERRFPQKGDARSPLNERARLPRPVRFLRAS